MPWIRAQRGSEPLVQGSSLQSSRGPEDGSCFTPPCPESHWTLLDALLHLVPME